jgi:FKBP-type peptidyl-prolyl cis-trans isomerase FkpA
MFQRTGLIITYCMLSFATMAQNDQGANNVFAYKTLNPQLKYAFIINKPTSPHPQEGDQITLNMQSVCNNRIMYNTAQAFKGKPAVYGVAKPAFKGDLIEAIMLMTPGDSIVCLVDAATLFKNSKSKLPDFIKPGDKMQYFIKLVSIKPKEQVQKEQQAAFMKQMKEQQEKQKAAAAKQMITDDKLLQSYFTRDHINPVKTTSGLYYTIKEEGSGEKPVAGDSITMNYKGTLLDGTEFDSNIDTAFKHVQPFQFVLGRGMVIKGWDEGVALLKTGSKATFYIPSPMAYGPQARPGGGANPKGIPANSILLFDVELISSKHPVPVAPVVVPKTDSSQTIKVDSVKTAPVQKKE